MKEWGNFLLGVIALGLFEVVLYYAVHAWARVKRWWLNRVAHPVEAKTQDLSAGFHSRLATVEQALTAIKDDVGKRLLEIEHAIAAIAPKPVE